MKNFNRLFLFVASIVFPLILSGPATAENGHAYNGSFCKPYLGSQSSDFAYYSVGIQNLASSARWLNCPVIVDEIANTNGTTRVWAHWQGSGTIRCLLYSNRSGGFQILQSRSSSDVNGGWFDVDPTRITADQYWGDYGMYCLLPARARLNMIWLGEVD